MIPIDKTVIKDIKKQPGDLIEYSDTTSYSVDCGLQTMQAIEFLTRSVQDLANRGLSSDVTIIQSIYTHCAKFYMAVQHRLTQTKPK